MRRKENLKIILIFTIIILSIVFIMVGGNYLFGSKTDWLSQHTIFPDYFRKLFYKTGNLFPNFAFNIGGGQNIYYFSYYGLLNPYIILSYLLPFIKMVNYLIVINIIIVIADGFLFYKWLRNNKIDMNTSLVTSIIFILVSPLLFHAHRHLMLTDYMPFLILGLIGIDSYFEDNKKWLLMFSIFLMILTSYYFSVGGLFVLVIYGIYKYIKKNNKISLKSFFITGSRFIIPIFIGIMMSAILLFPTISTILSRNSGEATNIKLISLLVPHFNYSALLYSSYGLGFTCVALIAIIYNLLKSKRENLFLNIMLVIIINIPLFVYALNGMLYVREKVLIPFVPLVGLSIAIFLADIKKKKIDKNIIVIILAICALLFIPIKHELSYYYYLDLTITILALLLYGLKNKISIVYITIIAISLTCNIVTNKSEVYMSKKEYNDLFGNKQQSLIDSVTKSDKSFYRFNNFYSDFFQNINEVYNTNYYQTSIYSSTYNDAYHSLYGKINPLSNRNVLISSESNSIMFQTLMGVKYVLGSDGNIPIGYSLIRGDKSIGVYENDNVFPLGYVSSSLLSSSDFSKLEYPFNTEALLNNIVVDKTVKSNYVSNIKLDTIGYQPVTSKDISISENNNIITVNSKNDSSVVLKLNEPIKNKVLFISFDVLHANNCKTSFPKDGDVAVGINGTNNTLTCKQWIYFNGNYNFKYSISSNKDINDLTINVNKGTFKLSNIKIYTLDYDYIKNISRSLDPFVVDTKKTVGDKIVGHVSVTKDGYFATTIPYDEGFTILVNNKKISYEKVNGAFIGFPIKKGQYKIEMQYNSPGYNMGMLGSIIGFIAFGVIIVFEKRKKCIK